MAKKKEKVSNETLNRVSEFEDKLRELCKQYGVESINTEMYKDYCICDYDCSCYTAEIVIDYGSYQKDYGSYLI